MTPKRTAIRMAGFMIVIFFFSGLALCLPSCKNKTNSENKQAVAAKESTKPKVLHSKENRYDGLRKLAFNLTPEQLSLTLPDGKTVAYGVIMDWGMDGGTATITSYLSGDASLYLSSGGGVIGGGQHHNVSNSAKQFVSSAQAYLERSAPTEKSSLPATGEVKFYLLTNKGTYTGGDIVKNFENQTSDWLPLFEDGNRVLTELRLTAQR